MYEPSEAERQDPELYAKNVRAAMAAAGGLQLSDLTLSDKRAYHQVRPLVNVLYGPKPSLFLFVFHRRPHTCTHRARSARLRALSSLTLTE